MKKVFIFLMAFAAITLSSCSSDDNGGGSSSVVKFKVGGQQKTFKFVTVNDAGGGELWVVAAASQAGTEFMSFTAMAEDPSSDSAYDFMYGSLADQYWSEAVIVTVTQNTATDMKGTFSGTFANFDGDVVTITDGTFDIHHE
jgi:hypothetical protein